MALIILCADQHDGVNSSARKAGAVLGTLLSTTVLLIIVVVAIITAIIV